MFSLQEILDLEPKTKYHYIFKEINVYPAVKILTNQFNKGANGYNKANIVRAFIAKQIEGISNTSALRRRLKDDLRFRISCGFKVSKSIPSVSTLCRSFKKLSDTNALDKIYNQLLEVAKDLDMIDPESIAIDSSKLESYDSPQPNSKIDKSEPNRADWGAKYDSNYNVVNWFGFKLHVACDTKGEIPISFKLTPANEADSKNALPLVDNVYSFFDKKPSYWLMDKGYDATEIYQKIVEDYDGQAIIPINKRNMKTPPVGFHDFKYTPQCSGGHKMVYWGHDGNYNKFRCPHATGKLKCCHGQKWCSDSDYGLVVKTKPSDNYRLVSLPHRGSKSWKKLYDKRTSVERVFSRLKETFNLENITNKGRKKAETHVKLNLIADLACKIAIKKSQIATKKKAA